MAYFSYDNLWKNDFDDIVARKDKIQIININELNFKVNDTWKKDEKTTTNSKPTNDEDVREELI